jgi:hypothetical protein
MLFSFKPLSITCESVLSTEDSEWGEADGIRLYFIVLTTGGFHQVLVSGPEHPVTDPRENYFFRPGKTLDLGQSLPQNAGTWEVMPPAGLSDVDSVMITILGVNEGLPSVGGGGGFGSAQKANLKGVEEIAKKGAEKAAEKAAGAAGEVIGGAAFGAAWSLIEGLVEEINRADECRGVAFCYPIELSMRKLLLDHLMRKDLTHRLDAAGPVTGLGLVAADQHPPGCGSSRYAVELQITRIDDLHLAVEDVAGQSRQGAPSPVEVKEEACRPPLGAEMQTWLTYADHTITFTPTHYFASLKPTWYVNGVELQRHSGSLDFSLPVTSHTGGEETTRSVRVEYERITRQGRENLVLSTKGEDGNFRLDVSLRLNFEGVHPPPPDPWVEFRSNYAWVGGSELEGNEAWSTYLRCVMDRQLDEATEKHILVEKKPKKPDEIDIATIKHGIQRTVLFKVLDAHQIEIR